MSNPLLSLSPKDQPEKWQQMLSDLITDPKELLQILELDESQYPGSNAALMQFPLKVPRPFVARIEKGNWQDPLLMQVLPTALEEQTGLGYVIDPLAESKANPVPGLLHKYRGRVLLTAAPHCAVHCRYCFRRHFDYTGNAPSRKGWEVALDYIAADSSIEEVILSGGDPLALSDNQLGWMVERISRIDHVSTLRIHTRLPIVIPQRISPGLVKILRESRAKPVVVIHCNHSAELAADVRFALNTLADNRITLLNQSVLLKDVNDNLPALTQLSKTLFRFDVLPYYLHLPDPIAGTAHFRVSEQEGKELIRQMQSCLPGYLVPHLVKEEAGADAKTRIA